MGHPVCACKLLLLHKYSSQEMFIGTYSHSYVNKMNTVSNKNFNFNQFAYTKKQLNNKKR